MRLSMIRYGRRARGPQARNTEKPRRARLFRCAAYTLCFGAVSALVFSWHIVYGKSLVWADDGLEQHFGSLVYYGEYLRGLLSGSAPLWDFSIGLGSDIIATMHYYVMGDPLSLLSVLFQPRDVETLYGVLILLRLYLAGAAFLAYCEKMRLTRFGSLIGSMTYVFCAFGLYACARHPFFINPMIYLPLMLCGVENAFSGGKPYLLIASVFVSALCSYYFFYMLCIMTALYASVRFFFVVKEARAKRFFGLFSKLFVYALTGALMAGVILLPSVTAALSSARVSADALVPALYEPSYYLKFFYYFTGVASPGYWTLLGFSGFALPAVILMLFTKRWRNRQFLVFFAALTLFALIPFAGHALNGFNYVTNRWIWAYAMLIGVMLAYAAPALLVLKRGELAIIAACIAGYGLAGLCGSSFRADNFLFSYAVVLLGAALVTAVYLQRKRGRDPNEKLVKALMLVITALGVSVNAYFLYSPARQGYILTFADAGTAYSLTHENQAAAVAELDDPAFFRYEQNRGDQPFTENAALLSGQYGTSYFFSLDNRYISSYLDDIANYSDRAHKYMGFDGRAMPDALACVKYFVVKAGMERYLPYGYTRLAHTSGQGGSVYRVYENEYALPLGYAYSAYITHDDYAALAPYEKQQAMMQCAVLASARDDLAKAEPRFTHSVVPYAVVSGGDAVYEDGAIDIKKDGAKITLLFEGAPDCETYLSFSGLRLTDSGQSYANISVTSGDIEKSFGLSMPGYQFYSGRHDFLINLCYAAEGRKSAEVSFSRKGRYVFSGLQVVCQPMAGYVSQAEALRANALENIVLKDNYVRGSLNISQPMALCLSIPYNGGFTAYVNGESAELLRVNGMYAGLVLDAGEHDIELIYTTPGLREGVTSTLLGFALFACVIISRRAKDKRLKRV